MPSPTGRSVGRRNVRRTRRKIHKTNKQTRRLGLETLERRQLLAAEVEPNDTTADATTVNAGDTLEGRLSRTTDVDFFVTTLSQGQRFEVNTANINAPRFDPTLPPGLEILNDAGETISTSFDGRTISLVAPAAGDYFIRVSSQNAFGTFVGEYGMQSRVGGVPSGSESEPNDNNTQADPVGLGATFTGALANINDVDTFTINATAGDSVVVAFAGIAENNPAVSVRTASGQRLGQDVIGNGVAVSVPASGPIYITMSAGNTNGPVTGQYTAVVNRFANSEIAVDTGDDFENADVFRSQELSESFVGELASEGDADLYRFEIDGIKFLTFDLQVSGSERIVETGKELRLYNQYGQLVEFATNGRLDTESVDALTPGTYFIEVAATSPVGTGAYALSYSTRTNFSLQRDNAVHFFDFDSNDPYLGFNRAASHAVPEAHDYYLGIFDSRYGVYEVEKTLVKPVAGNDRVASGIGDFGDIGAGGFGGGSRGTRSSQGNTVNNALETSANSLRYLGTVLVMHEFGHATGLPHAREAQAFMSYVGTAETLPVGSGYAFRGTDSRRPQDSIYDVRDYLDWALQPGAQVYVPEQLDSAGTPLLNEYLREMSLDPKTVANYATGTRPFDVATGDFNDDGRPDVAVANDGDNTISIFLAQADGSLSAQTAINVGVDLRFWTEALEIADFDGDGDDDIAVAAYAGRRVSVYLSNGNGTFANAVNYATPRETQGLEVADINSDGIPDLIAVTTVTGRGYTFIGDGSGSFNAGSNFTAGSNTYSVTAGDFNGDGRIDLATANVGSDNVIVMRGDGTGTFSLQETINVGENPESVTSGDFNNDGIDDLAIASRNNRTVTLLEGNTGGRMTRSGKLDVPFNPRFLEVDDADLDGNLDIIIGGFGSTVQFALGDGFGGFTRPVGLQAGHSEAFAAVGDFDSDGVNEVAIANNRGDNLAIMDADTPNDSNDRVAVYSRIDGDEDIDRYQLNVSAGDRWTLDIDSAEFQYPLDAIIDVYDSTGRLIANSDDGLDGNSGFDSVDPFIDHVFASDGVVTIEVSGKLGSSGAYRFKVTPERALDQDGPQLNAVFPENESTINGTKELIFYFDEVLDPATLTDQNITVVGATGGAMPGTVSFNPLESTLIWNAENQLPADTYTVTLNGNAGGISDLAGNLLDGEIATDFRFPVVSGDHTPGGSFMTTFTVNQTDGARAQVRNVSYLRDPYNRGRFTISFNDHLSVTSVHNADFTLRGTGTDGAFHTADDTLVPLDATYDAVNQTFRRSLNLYSRGIPDSGRYLLEGQIEDAAGLNIFLSEPISVSGSVPESALFTDAAATSQGLTGSYVNSNLRSYSVEDDWRASQAISGTRVDPQVAFSRAEFGDKTTVGVTGGPSNENWDNFSVQWDGFIRIPEDGIQLLTRSDDGSRMWVDLNGDGNLLAADGELFDNGWGTGHGVRPGELTPPLTAGTYQIRIQYEESTGREQMHLEWLRAGAPVDVDGFIHGPSVTDVSITPGSHLVSSTNDSISVQFSGNIDTSTLTTSNLSLRRSPGPNFFDSDDVILVDSDGIVAWDPVTLTATLQFDAPLQNGFYLLEAEGDSGGIADPAGHLLDGEFLSAAISGTTNPFSWQNTPSGNGIAGGDYRASFSIAQPTLAIDLQTREISERGGRTTATISRRFADISQPVDVRLSVSDATELQLATNLITIPAGVEFVTVDVNAIDDDLVDGTQLVTITASAVGLQTATEVIGVTDYETLTMRLSSSSLSENGGTAGLTITRLDQRGDLVINLINSRPDKASVPDTVTIPDGTLSVTVTITGVDNNILDGTQLVVITAQNTVLIDSTATFDVTDYEELTLDVFEDSISELGGSTLATLTRTDPRGNLLAGISTFPSGQLVAGNLIQFLDGELISQPFTLDAVDNTVLDGDRLVTVIAEAQGYVDGTDEITITDHEELSFVFDTSSISELGGIAVGRVIRTDPTGDVTITLSTTNDGRLSIPAAITILDGQTSSDNFPVTAIDNVLVDGDETIDVRAMLPGYVDGVEQIEVTDFEPLALNLVGGPIFENSGTATFRLSRPAAGIPATIDLTGTLPGFFTIPDQVTFAETDTFITFTGQIDDNQVVGGDRTVTIGADSGDYIAASLDFQVGEDDVPELFIDIDQNQLVENFPGFSTTNETLIRVSRNTRHEMAARVDISPLGSLSAPGIIQFPAGRSFVEFTVEVNDNDIADGTRDVNVSVVAVNHPAVSDTITITDDEIPSFDWSTGEVSVTEGGPAATASIVLDVAPVSTVVINFDELITDQLQISPSTISFSPGNWNVPQEISIAAIDDDTTENELSTSVSATVDITSPTLAFRGLDPALLSVTITDNDTPGIELEETDGSTIVTELGIDDEFSLSLRTRPLSDVRLTIDGAEVPEAVFTPISVTFTPENWDQPQTVNVSTPLDFDVDQHLIGSVYIRVDALGSDPAYAPAKQRQFAAVHVDSVLSDLRIRRDGNQIVLTDQITGQILRSTDADGLPGSEITMGSRGERVFVEQISNASGLMINTVEGDDTISLDEYAVGAIDGGLGFDTLIPLRTDETLMPGALGTVDLLNIERIDLSGDGVQRLSLSGQSVDDLTDERNTLHVITSGDDEVTFQGTWTADTPILIDGIATHVLRQNGTTIQLTNGSIWQNPSLRHDVDGNGEVTSRDALLVINYQASNPDPVLPTLPNSAGASYYDVNGDGLASSIDALQIINKVRDQSVFGEPELAGSPASVAQRWSPIAIDQALDSIADDDDEGVGFEAELF